MNNQEKLKTLIREEIRKEIEKATLSEGLLQKLLMAFLSPMIKREAKKLKNDPDIIAAQQSVQYALDNYIDALKRQSEYLEKSTKEREEEHKKFMKRIS